MTSRSISSDRGFTLIEMLIVMGILAVVAGFGLSHSLSSIARANIQSERDLYVSLLTEARARAIANVDESAHGVYIDAANDRYVVYKGADQAAGTDKTYVPMSTDAIFDGNLDRSFAPLSVRVIAGQTGTTTLGFANASSSVSVNSVGRIDW